MPNRRSAVGPPASYVRGPWPTGRPVAGAPRALELARDIAVRLAEAIEGRSITEVASASNLARSTIYDVVNGSTWPDLVSVGQLEEALGITLLPKLPESDASA